MNRIILSFFCFVLFSTTNYAQYTSIINASRPGDTETPYSVGKRVFQIENSLLYNKFNNKNDVSKIKAFSNDINLQYGFLSKRLQANLNHQFTHGEINNNPYDVTGTENLSIGLKYLIYEHINKESPTLKKSWKRRYGFKYNGLIPSVAIAVNYHTPFANSKFFNGGLNSFSMSFITQNNINKRLRINNQLDYNNFQGNYATMSYSLSSSYIISKRWNPYLQFQHHGTLTYFYNSLGIGTPFLINKNLAISAHYNTSFGKKVSGHEVGLNLAFRIDHHSDKWEYINKPKEDDDEDDEDGEEGEEGEEGENVTDENGELLESNSENNNSKEDKKTEKKRLKAEKKAEKKRLKEEKKAEKKRLKEEKKQLKEVDESENDTILSY